MITREEIHLVQRFRYRFFMTINNLCEEAVQKNKILFYIRSTDIMRFIRNMSIEI